MFFILKNVYVNVVFSMLLNFYCEYAVVANVIKVSALQMNWIALVFTKAVFAY